MKVIQTIIHPKNEHREPLIIENFTHNIDDEKIREGFEKKKIRRTVIEMNDGHKIVYERKK